jgi:hypothetical protein
MGVQRYSQPLIVQAITDGPTLTAAAAASCLPTPNVITLPNNYWEAGKQWRVTLCGRMSSVITTPGTARFDIRIGGVIAWDSLAVLLDTVAGHTNMPFRLEVFLTCRTIGAGTASTLFGMGLLYYEGILGTPAASPKAGAVAMLPWNTAPVVGTGFNNTLANSLDIFFTQTVATGSMTVHQYQIEEIG